MLWSFAKMTYADRHVIVPLLRRVRVQAQDLRPRGVSNVAWAIVSGEWHVRGGTHRVARSVLRRLSVAALNTAAEMSPQVRLPRTCQTRMAAGLVPPGLAWAIVPGACISLCMGRCCSEWLHFCVCRGGDICLRCVGITADRGDRRLQAACQPGAVCCAAHAGGRAARGPIDILLPFASQQRWSDRRPCGVRWLHRFACRLLHRRHAHGRRARPSTRGSHAEAPLQTSHRLMGQSTSSEHCIAEHRRTPRAVASSRRHPQIHAIPTAQGSCTDACCGCRRSRTVGGRS